MAAKYANNNNPDGPASTFRVTANINRFLNHLCLYGVASDGNGGVVRTANTRARYIALCVSHVAVSVTFVTCRFCYSYWGEAWDIRTSTKCALTLILMINVLLLFAVNYKTDMKRQKAYYCNFETIDRMLRVSVDMYCEEMKICNELFFTSSFLILLQSFCIGLSYGLIYSFAGIWPFFNDYLNNCIVNISLMNVIIKIYIVHERFKVYVRQSTEEAALNEKDSKRCYHLFLQQLHYLSIEHGWQVLLSLVYFVFYATRTISILATTESDRITLLATALAGCLKLSVLGLLLSGMVMLLQGIHRSRSDLMMWLEEKLLDEHYAPSVEPRLRQVRRQPLALDVCGLFRLTTAALQMLLSITVSYTVLLAQARAA